MGDGRRRVDSDDSNKGGGCGLDKFVRFLYANQKIGRGCGEPSCWLGSHPLVV